MPPPLRVARLPVTTDSNPYQALLYEHLVGRGIHLVGSGSLGVRWLVRQRRSIDVLHLHWRLDRLAARAEPGAETPERAVGIAGDAARLARFATRLLVARLLGYRIVWTVHEAGRTGRGRRFDRGAAWLLAHTSHATIAHDRASADVLRRNVGGRTATVAPLGHYGDVYPPAGGVMTRRSLGIPSDATVFLVFGHLRADKEAPAIVEAFRRVAVDTDGAVLLVVGRADPDVARDLRRVAAATPAVCLVLDHIPDEHVGDVFAVADCSVLARRDDWTPSSGVLSLSLGVPVIAADLPSTREHLGPGTVCFPPGDLDALAAAMRLVVANPAVLEQLGALGQAHVRARTWDSMADIVARELTGDRTGRAHQATGGVAACASPS